MDKGFIAQTTITINTPIAKVWDALINPQMIKQYFFGTTVVTNWEIGAPIVWKGEWQGKQYEDKGQVLEFKPEELLVVTHYSPLSGVSDVPENYHTLRYELTQKENTTHLTLTQDNNASEQEKEHSEKNWQMVLESLKKLLE